MLLQKSAHQAQVLVYSPLSCVAPFSPPVRTPRSLSNGSQQAGSKPAFCWLIKGVHSPAPASKPTVSVPSVLCHLFSEYNVGLALLRLGKVMSTAGASGADSSASPAVDCRVLDGAGQGEAELRRCLPLTPPWWPADLDPATGKVPA